MKLATYTGEVLPLFRPATGKNGDKKMQPTPAVESPLQELVAKILATDLYVEVTVDKGVLICLKHDGTLAKIPLRQLRRAGLGTAEQGKPKESTLWGFILHDEYQRFLANHDGKELAREFPSLNFRTFQKIFEHALIQTHGRCPSCRERVFDNGEKKKFPGPWF